VGWKKDEGGEGGEAIVDVCLAFSAFSWEYFMMGGIDDFWI